MGIDKGIRKIRAPLGKPEKKAKLYSKSTVLDNSGLCSLHPCGSLMSLFIDGIIIPVEEHRDSGDSGGTGNAYMYKGTPECGHQERSRA